MIGNELLYNKIKEYCGNNYNEIKETLEYFNERYESEIEQLRICNECGNVMNEGYCIDNGLEYYCSEECLHKHYTEEEYLKMYDNGNGDSYYTEWEE